MSLSLRSAHLALIAVMWLGMLGVTIIGLALGWGLATNLTQAAATAVLALLFAATWRGWRHAALATILFAVVITPLAPPDVDLDPANCMALLIPSIMAVIIGRSWWVGATAAAASAIFVARSGGQSLAETDPSAFVVFAMAVGGLWLGRWVVERALRAAEQQAAVATGALTRAEAQAEQLSAANREQQALIAEQRALLDLVATLETPAVQIAEQSFLAPLVGQLDPRRMGAVAARLLELAHERRARLVVLDISGVPSIDAAAAQALAETAQALRLIGCRVTISGVGAAVAAAVVAQGIRLGDAEVVRSPHEVLRHLAGGT